jgi:hypothetical protein
MTITAEQRTWARVAAIMILLNYVLQFAGDGVTIIARGDYFETARFAAANPVLWRFSLVNVALAWISIGVFAFALYVVLEPVNRRLAQLALVLRLGASFVGASSMAFRVAQGRLYQLSTRDELFTTDQLRALSGVVQRGAGTGVEIAWILQFLGSILFFALFLRSRYLPTWIARLGLYSAIAFIPACIAMQVWPQRINELKLVGLPYFVAEVLTAIWLLTRGLRAPATTGARA